MVRPKVLLTLALAAGLTAVASAAASAADNPPAPATTAAAPLTAAASGGPAGPELRLDAQTPWVAPGQAMQIDLYVGRPAAQMTVAVYQCLSSRSAFAATEAGNPIGPVESAATFAVDSLPAGPAKTVDLTMPVDDGSTPVTGSGPITAKLNCPTGPSGVYPVRISVRSASGAQSSLFTYVVYANPSANTQKLRVAMVLPLTGPPASGDGGSAAAPNPSTVSITDQVLSTLGAHSDVPVTLALEPAWLAALGATTQAKAAHALGTLTELAQTAGHETLAQSFVPTDASALVAAGLPEELAAQVRRASLSLTALHPTTNTWVSTAPLDSSALGALGGLGYDQVVVPASGVAVYGSHSALTPTRPFTLDAGSGVTPLALESDVALGNHLAAASGPQAALAAYQFLADLALVYYEEPNLDTARGVVAVAPDSWSPQPVFLSTLMTALERDPVVQPETLDTLFSSLPATSDGVRRPTAATPPPSMPGRAVRTARSKLSAFTSAVGGPATGVLRGLDEAILRSEDERLRPAEQNQVLAGFGRALKFQLDTLSIRTDTVRLTSSAAKVPITIVKQSPYTLSGVLEVTSDKVIFPGGAAQQAGSVCRTPVVNAPNGRSTFTCQATVGQSTNAIYVDMRARATGDFRLSVTLTSPTGGLVLVSSELTVRSLSVSVVAIALSVAALAVLLAWWGRSVWRGKRPARRGAHAKRRKSPAT